MCRSGVSRKTLKELHGSVGGGGDVSLSLCNLLSLLSCLKLSPVPVKVFSPTPDTLLGQSIPVQSLLELLLVLLRHSLIARRTATIPIAVLHVPGSSPALGGVVPVEVWIVLAPVTVAIGRIDAAIHEQGVAPSDGSNRSRFVLNGDVDLELRHIGHLLFHFSVILHLLNGFSNRYHFAERLSFDFDGICGPVENTFHGSGIMIDRFVLESVLRIQPLIPGILDRSEVRYPVLLFALLKAMLGIFLCMSPVHDCIFADCVEFDAWDLGKVNNLLSISFDEELETVVVLGFGFVHGHSNCFSTINSNSVLSKGHGGNECGSESELHFSVNFN